MLPNVSNPTELLYILIWQTNKMELFPPKKNFIRLVAVNENQTKCQIVDITGDEHLALRLYVHLSLGQLNFSIIFSSIRPL